jgi:serine/threonine-protein kinase
MNCPNCHRPLRDGAQFCTSCGTRTAHDGRDSLSDSVPTVEPAGRGAVPRAPADPLVGRVLDGKYEILSRLGEGGMGSVYLARRVHIGDEVAVKVLHAKFVDDETLVERFRREARAAAQLQHPNVVTIHDYGEGHDPEGFAYIVMELVRGVSLRELLRREGHLDVPRAVALMRDICAGVGAAHRRGIVHRDIKPDNIIVLPPDEEGERERVKVVDFGIAKLRDMAGDSTLTQTGAMVGTPFYMSPEQCRGEALDARADVYSLGALLYEMLAGQPPFVATSITGVISKHLTEPPPSVPDNLKVPHALEAAIARALDKNPEARPRDAIEFAREVQAAGSGALATADASPQTRPIAPVQPLSDAPAPVVPIPQHAAHMHAPQHAQQTYAHHAQQTFHPPPRKSKLGRLLLVVLGLLALLAGTVTFALVGLYRSGKQDVGNRANANRSRQANATPASANTNTPSKEDIALADRIAIPEQKILRDLLLTPEDLAGLKPEDLRVLRNVPFARYGRVFQDARLQGYFQGRPWYDPNPKFTEDRLTPTDRANAEFLASFEGGGRTQPSDTTQLAKEIGATLDDWAESTNARDIEEHMRHYAPRLDVYYLKQGIPSAQVRAERASAFARYDSVDVKIDNLEVTPDPTGLRATVTFDKTWEFDSENRTTSGSVKQQLTLARIGGRWLITGERDLQVYYTN